MPFNFGGNFMLKLLKRLLVSGACLVMLTALSAVSAYTVTFYNNDVLYDTKTVANGSALLIDSDAVENDKYLKGWLSSDGKSLYGYRIVPNSDMALYSLWSECETPRPGVNLFANSDMNSDYFDVRPSNGSVSFVTEADGNRALMYNRGSAYASMQRYVKWEA